MLRRRVCWDHWEVVLYFTDWDISLWCRWFLSISGFDSVSGAHFSPESFQRFIYFNQIGHFVVRRRVCWDHWEVVLYITDWDISLWCRWFLSISGFDSVSGAHFSPESFQRFIYFIQIGQFVHRRRVCLHHWEVVLYFTDLDISLWCRWFLSISGFDSGSGAHFSPESFQRFIYFIQNGQFVLRRSVCLHHWEVVLYFTDLDISLWCRWFLSISGFDSVSGAHFSPESFQRIIYFIQIGHFVLKRRVCWDHREVEL